MEIILTRIIREIIFWMAWIMIPLIMEIIPAIGGFFILLRKKMSIKKAEVPLRLPEITLIIPVYNSAETLRGCLESVYLSNYPSHLIDIMLVNNQSKDNSFEIFGQCQKEFNHLSMRWLNAKQGKSKALNLALFNSHGKYIIHIDSDGKLHPEALRNMVFRFEQNLDIHCLTGAILTDAKIIEATDNFLIKLIRRCEFFEYCQAFLAGRNFESEINSIYTISGAFSAFRKSVILKTQQYNTATVCEDTHVTFQVRHLLKKNVNLCENAFFFVDPIEDLNKLYTQRQRWQRGEIEVSHMFLQDDLSVRKGVAFNFMVRLLMFDHTFAFPRMIWYFALFYLAFLNYPMNLIIGSMVIIYLLYALAMFLFYINVYMYLNENKDIRKYYASKWYLIFILPLFNFYVFWIRFAGIINSTKGEGRWKTATMTEEWKRLKKTVREDFKMPRRFIKKMRKIFNKE